MATFDWPASLTPQTVSWTLQKASVAFRSPFAGSVESIEFPGQFWKISITLPTRKMVYGGEGEAFFARLAGGAERVLVPYWPRRQPAGTMRGSPGLNAAVARGDLTMQIATTSAVESLKAGDMFSVGGQMLQAFSDCIGAGGVLNVALVNRVRAAMSLGTAVIWNTPTVLCCVPATMSARGYSPGVAAALAVDLEEVPT